MPLLHQAELSVGFEHFGTLTLAVLGQPLAKARIP